MAAETCGRVRGRSPPSRRRRDCLCDRLRDRSENRRWYAYEELRRAAVRWRLGESCLADGGAHSSLRLRPVTQVPPPVAQTLRRKTSKLRGKARARVFGFQEGLGEKFSDRPPQR